MIHRGPISNGWLESCPLIDSFSQGSRLRSLLMDEKRESRRYDSLFNVLSRNIKFMRINFFKFLKADLHDFPRRVTDTTISRDQPHASSDKSQKVLNKGCPFREDYARVRLVFHVNTSPWRMQHRRTVNPRFSYTFRLFTVSLFLPFPSFPFPFHPRVLLARFSCGVYTNSKG